MQLAQVEAMRKLGRDFSAAAAKEKAAALKQMAGLPIEDADTLLAWHDCLLFLLAYPQNATLRRQCEKELERVAGVARAMAQGPEGLPEALIGSGLAWTSTAVTFNYQIATWLAGQFPAQTRLHAIRGEVEALRQALSLSLPAAEFETLAEPCETPRDLLIRLGAEREGHPLAWLLENLAAIACPEAMKRQIYRNLRVFVAIDSRDSVLSRTFLRGLAHPAHYHKAPLSRGENVQALLDQPLPPAIDLTAVAKRQLLQTARGILALQGRQTEPISDCDGRGVYAYDLGRGVVIALFSAAPADRPPLDSHIGMMLFKNGMPIAYGGGWPFLGVCKIGINIFEPYRGGESHFLFLSVMRAYRHLFGVRRFIVERYQFGRNNPEGIASGAYWFYYRLGFRSMSGPLADLAQKEWTKLQAAKGHATPKETLEKFTEAHMEMRLPGCPTGYGYCDPADLSRAVTAVIKGRFRGNRQRFVTWAVRRVADAIRLDNHDLPALQALAPVLALIPNLEGWPARERHLCRTWVLAKDAGDERRYFAILHQHTRLQAALEAIPGQSA